MIDSRRRTSFQTPYRSAPYRVFSYLTKLQHLELEAHGQAGMARVKAADAAALTASSHLTSLVLRPDFDLLPVELLDGGLFGPGLQVLPDMVQLCTGPGLLKVHSSATCCALLQQSAEARPGRSLVNVWHSSIPTYELG